MISGQALGWIAWSILSIPGVILIYAAINELIIDWRWKRACKRGEIKPYVQERLKAKYLVAPRVN